MDKTYANKINLSSTYGITIAQKRIEEFKANGFTVIATFPEEYTLMKNKKWDKVRVYIDGSVWATDILGRYQKKTKDDKGD